MKIVSLSLSQPFRRLARQAAALAALACMAAGAPALADELPTFNLVIRAGKFYPDVIEVPANTKWKLTIHNEGPGAEEFESIELRKEKVLAPGASSFLVFAPMKPGTYKFFGDFHPETAQGKIVAK
ncbi:cupredoxin domain-containing protein [Oryzomicrobium sp.]|uniref:cupredoxin domain-containing protein n=1 Tax=Oryzomicrobium sp. TaxID=1911578 RepID=UPI0025E89E46|nr:cupredoxin domain-containing protein [Oryzomicrobium sp.]MCE1242722.1 cupredoxin domain-containing protein [Oryzomicrobium sp.]